MSNVLVVAEVTETGALRKTTLSAIAGARKIANLIGGTYSILVLGKDVAQAAQELARFGAASVLCADDPAFAQYLAESFAPTVATVGRNHRVIVACASSYGKDLMPRVAARLDAAYAGDTADVGGSSEQLRYKRPMFAGNAFGWCELGTPIEVVTLRQSEFAPAEPTSQTSPIEPVSAVAPGRSRERVEFVGLAAVASERPELSDAKVVVSGGRALKESFFQVLEPLADVLGAAIGASRAACDAGYAPGDFQVGQTGKIVAPSLYIAIGISGAIQHIAGMKGSRTIVAINKDPEAPIFQLADYGLVADLFQAVPELVEKLKERAAQKT